MLRWPLSLVCRLGAAAEIRSMAWMGWHNPGQRKPETGTVRQELAAKVAPNMVEHFRTSRGNVREAALRHFNCKSNRTNASVPGVYTLAGALPAWRLVGAALNCWYPVVNVFAAVPAAIVYNIRIMPFALRLEEA